MNRPRMLAAALAALTLLLVPASASAAEVTQVLWGGRITNEGTGSGSYKINAERLQRTESFRGSWKSSYIAPSLYFGNDDQVAIVGEHPAWEDHADSWSAGASGSTYRRDMSWDHINGWRWNKPVNCTLVGTSDDPGGITPPGTGPNRPIHVDSFNGYDLWDRSSCSSGSVQDAYSDIADELWTGSTIQFRLGQKPTVGNQRVQPYTFQQKTTDCTPQEEGPCTQSWSGSGKVTLECVLCVTSMTVEHQTYPSDSVITIPDDGTTDGNKVFVTAKVQNRSRHTYPTLIEWRERKSNRVVMTPLEGKQLVTFPANSTTTVVLEWDTAGFAYEKGKPLSDREIELRTPLGGAFTKVKVKPRPIVMVHGWKADASGWGAAKGLITKVHPLLAGQGYAVGDGQFAGKMNTNPVTGHSIASNAREMATYVRAMRDETEAAHVDVLAHSMGGLISRHYIQELMPAQKDYHAVIGGLLMLGTPNRGSHCADLMAYGGVRGIPTQQLRPQFVDGPFNASIRNFRGVEPSILAGNMFDYTCLTSKRGDGVVDVESARWLLTDFTETYAEHVEITDIPALYDGWIKKRLALDPDGRHNFWQYDPAHPPVPQLPRKAAAEPTAAAAAAAAAADEPEPEIQGVKGATVTVPAGGGSEVEIPVSDGTQLGVAVLAPAEVASELVAPDGAVVDPVAAGSTRAGLPIRAHRAGAPAPGVWKLRLSQAGGAPAEVQVSAGLIGSALRLSGTATQAPEGGPITVRAQLRSGEAPVPGAAVTAELRSADGDVRTIELADRGAGRYRAESEALPAGEWFATVTARGAGGDRIAALVVRPPADGDADGDGDGDGKETPVEQRPDPPVEKPSQPIEPIEPIRPVETGPVAPRALTLAAKAKRDRRKPFAFRLSGKVELPAGTAAGACEAGQVLVSLHKGKRTLAARRVKLDAGCSYRATLKAKRRGRFVARARFLGSTGLLPAAARVAKVRAG